MPLQLAYKELRIYATSKKLVYACYEITSNLPSEEKNNLTQQIRTASLSVYTNIAEGAFLQSKKKRIKCLRTAQRSLIIIDATTDLLIDLNYIPKEKTNEIAFLILECYQLLNEFVNS